MIEVLVPAAFVFGVLVWLSSTFAAQPKKPLAPADDNEIDELTPVQGCRVFRIGVHGESFSNDDGSSRQQIISRCRVGDPMTLVPEPMNPVDHLAVRVCTKGGRQIGYLPAGHGMTKKITAGRIQAWIEKINTSSRGRGFLGVVLKIAERTDP